MMDCGGEVNDGEDCRDDQVCTAGVCACAAGEIECNAVCIDPLSNNDNCGAMMDCVGDAHDGEQCLDTRQCVAGSCECAGGLVECGGNCIDPDNDEMFCGASGDCRGANAGTDCLDDEVCSAGTCAANCAADQVHCGDECIDPLTDDKFCGASGDCMGANDGENCTAASQVCKAGACEEGCNPENPITVSGILTTSIGTFDFAGADATIELGHERDVNTGCINHLSIVLDTNKDTAGGCKLELLGNKYKDSADRLHVNSIRFSGGNQCHPISEDKQGTYVTLETTNSWVGLGVSTIPDDNAETSCVETTLSLDLRAFDVDRVAGAGSMGIRSSSITIRGEFVSNANELNSCPELACDPLAASSECRANEGCFPSSTSLAGMNIFTCQKNGTDTKGHPCTVPFDCDAGLTCVTSADLDDLCFAGLDACCTEYCVLWADDCDDTETCKVANSEFDEFFGVCAGEK